VIKNVIAVIVSAYETPVDWLLAALNSIESQELPQDTLVKIFLGIDGDRELSTKLTKLNIVHWYSDKNVGTYVIRNSLMAQITDDVTHIASFDSDDIMLPNHIGTLLTLAAGGIAYAKMRRMDELLKVELDAPKIAGNVYLMPVSCLKRLGGYNCGRVAMDSDLRDRARKLQISQINSSEVSALRRFSKNSLSQSPETGIKSAYRQELVQQYRKRLRVPRYLQIIPATTHLKKISKM
jgi:hypothetical protein